jgi:hypothetical protein
MVFESFECLCHRSTVNILKVNSARLERNVRNAMANLWIGVLTSRHWVILGVVLFSRCSDFQLEAGLFLKNAQNGEKVCSAWISARTQHSMQALTGDTCKCTQLFESKSRIYEVSENRFANGLFAAEISIDRFREQGFSERDITLSPGVSGFSKISS